MSLVKLSIAFPIAYPFSRQPECTAPPCSLLHPMTSGTLFYADWYWICRKVLFYLPPQWNGLCTFSCLRSMFTIIHVTQKNNIHNLKAIDNDSPPAKHQLRSKWDKFWGCLFPRYSLTQTWNELEKVHYHLALFANATMEALAGVKDELMPLCLMTLQNRMVLDMLLAKGGSLPYGGSLLLYLHSR